jgi:predicted Zn-ribbon and HTH transcriptional regulator
MSDTPAKRVGYTLRPLPVARCKSCGWEAHAGAFNVAKQKRRLLACPKCASVDVDTSRVLAVDPGFRFGKGNVLTP